MAGVDTPEPKAAKKGVGLRHPSRRVGVRIDMTPMVDIAFLLLIFFMVTTVFRAPQALEMKRPPKDTKVQVAESNVLIMLVDKDGRMFWRYGEESLQPVLKKDLTRFFKDQLTQNPQVTVLIKLNRDAKYETMVDLMDDLEYSKMTRFSLIPMTEDDVEEVMEMP
ncbi:MAG: biopolymer transporter ExbD [bacterium]